eukprot:1153458-Pelagomonas_calceolata.AAC.1
MAPPFAALGKSASHTLASRHSNLSSSCHCFSTQKGGMSPTAFYLATPEQQALRISSFLACTPTPGSFKVQAALNSAAAHCSNRQLCSN